MIRNLWFANHAIFEIGDDEHHVRFDLKDAWDGNPFNFQIDQITLWDSNSRYDIPCNKDYLIPYIEDLIGTVESATSAISNGDDMPAMNVLKEIHGVKEDLQTLISARSFRALTNG